MSEQIALAQHHLAAAAAARYASSLRPESHSPFTWLLLTMATIPKGRQQNRVTSIAHTR